MRFLCSICIVVGLFICLGYTSPEEDDKTTGSVPVISFHELLEEFGISATRQEEPERDETIKQLVDFNTAFLRGSIYLEKGSINKGIEEMKSALEHIPDATIALSSIAHGYFRLDEYDTCIEVCDQILSVDSKNLDALPLKARTLNITGKWKEAKKVSLSSFAPFAVTEYCANRET